MTKIPRALAHGIVKSWTRKRGFPTDDAEIKELVDTVQKYALSKEHARDIRSSLEDVEYCPEIPVIRRVAFSTRPTMRRRSDGCPRCAGTGFLRVALDHGGVDVGGVRPCTCRTSEEVMAGVSEGLEV